MSGYQGLEPRGGTCFFVRANGQECPLYVRLCFSRHIVFHTPHSY